MAGRCRAVFALYGDKPIAAGPLDARDESPGSVERRMGSPLARRHERQPLLSVADAMTLLQERGRVVRANLQLERADEASALLLRARRYMALGMAIGRATIEGFADEPN